MYKMPKVTQLWTDTNLMKIGIYLFIGRLLVPNGNVWAQKVVKTSPNLYLRKVKEN